jgi:hypothetical protein
MRWHEKKKCKIILSLLARKLKKNENTLNEIKKFS